MERHSTACQVVNDDPIISAEYAIKLTLELDPEGAVDLLRKWHEGNWRYVQMIMDALGA